MNPGPGMVYNMPGNGFVQNPDGFKRDPDRQKWASSLDFYATCIMNSIGIIHFSLIPLLFMGNGFVIFIIPYAIGMFGFGLPVFYLQAFLGQFSGTGLISAFRIAPLYKAVSYFMAFINFVSASSYLVLAGMPLLYACTAILYRFAPWTHCFHDWNSMSCRVFNSTEMKDLLGLINDTHLNKAVSQIPILNASLSEGEFNFAVYEYFYYKVDASTVGLVSAVLLVWILLFVVMMTRLQFIGKLMKFFVCTSVVFLLVVLVRLLFLPGAMMSLFHFLCPNVSLDSVQNLIGSPMITLLAFGSGWGTILTLASFNDFKQDIGKSSVVVFVAQLVALFVGGLCCTIATDYAKSHLDFDSSDVLAYNPFLLYPQVFESIKLSNIWIVLFFMVLFMGEFSSCIVQMLSITTALADEHFKFRNNRMKFTALLLFLLGWFACVFLREGGTFLVLLSIAATGVYQMLFCFIELIMVGFCYGKIQLQRDIKFMTGKELESWKLILLRFIAPILTLCAAYAYGEVYGTGVTDFFTVTTMSRTGMLLLKLCGILIVPIVMLSKCCNQVGPGKCSKSCQRTEWYPTDPVYREKYHECLGNQQGAQQGLMERQPNTLNV